MKWHKSRKAHEIFKDAIGGIEKWCKEFNSFAVIFFIYLKFIFVFIMFTIGTLTLLKLRGIYLKSRGTDQKEDTLKKPRLFLGCFYIFFAFGILFNFLTYFLIWALEPLPDRFIFNFINFHGKINPDYMNRIKDIEKAEYAWEKTVYYCIAIASFVFTLNLILSIWYLINNNRVISNPRKVIMNLIDSLIGGMIFGFSTFLPFFL
jgi:hypothetical protein